MKTNPKTEAEIVRLHHAEGWPIGTIGRQMRVHASVVVRVLGQAGVARSTGGTSARSASARRSAA